MKKLLIFITLLVLLVGGLFYFKNDIQKGIVQFQKTDLGLLIQEVGKEIFAPPPLTFLGPQNNNALTAENVVLETNLQRHDNGLLALKQNSILVKSALEKAQDMFKNQYFEHVSPSGVGPGELNIKNGYDYIVVGENLILGNFSSEKEVVQKWMDSPGHRANILNKRYAEIGVAMVKGTYKGETVWIGVQEFGLPSSVCPKPSEAMKNQIVVDKARLDQLAIQINQKKAEIDNSKPGSSEYHEAVSTYNNLVQMYNDLVQASKSLVAQYNTQVSSFNNCIQVK